MTPLKKCTKCGEEKPATKEFFYLKDKKLGMFFSECKPCRTEIMRQWRKRNPDKAKAIKNRFESTHPEYRVAKAKRYYQRHKDEIKQRCKAWRDDNKEKLNKLVKDWHKTNADSVKRRKRRYIDELADGYVKDNLKTKGVKTPTKELIELKKIHLTLKRKHNERKKNEQPTNS